MERRFKVLQHRAGSRDQANKVRTVVAAARGAPDLVLIGPTHLPTNLRPVFRPLRAYLLLGPNHARHDRSAVPTPPPRPRARAVRVLAIVAANLIQVGRAF